MYLSLCARVYSVPSWITLIIRACVATGSAYEALYSYRPNCRCLYEQLRGVKVKVRASSFAIQINSSGQLKSVGNCIHFLATFDKSPTLVMLFKAP